MPTRIAPRRVTVPEAGAVSSRTTGAAASACSSLLPPWAVIQRHQACSAEPSATACSTRRRASAASIPRSESTSSALEASQTSSLKSGGPSPRTRRERLPHLERVADRGAERLVHVGEQADDLAPGLLAEREHRLGERARVVERLHEGPVADLDVEHDRLGAAGELLRHDRGGDQRQLVDGRGDVAQRVEQLVGGDELRALPDDREPDLAAAATRTPRVRARRGSPGSTRACRACRRCGRGRGRSSCPAARRRRRRSARPRARSCRRPRRSSACRRPCARARRRDRASRRCATIASVSAKVSRGERPRK